MIDSRTAEQNTSIKAKGKTHAKHVLYSILSHVTCMLICRVSMCIINNQAAQAYRYSSEQTHVILTQINRFCLAINNLISQLKLIGLPIKFNVLFIS